MKCGSGSRRFDGLRLLLMMMMWPANAGCDAGCRVLHPARHCSFGLRFSEKKMFEVRVLLLSFLVVRQSRF